MGKEIDKIFGPRMEAIPEMEGAARLIGQRPEVVARALTAYRQLVGVVASLNPKDWEMIERVNLEYGKEDGQNLFLRKLGRERIGEVVEFLRSEFRETEECGGAINRICTMMENAHKKKVENPNWVPRDGDPETDKVIWGQMLLTTDDAKVALAIGHFVSQLIYQKFNPVEGEWGKDDFLSLTDVVAWIAVKYPAYLPNELLELVYYWTLPKPKDLGWITKGRDRATMKVFEGLSGQVQQE